MSYKHVTYLFNQYVCGVNVLYTGTVLSAAARLYTERWLSDEVVDL